MRAIFIWIVKYWVIEEYQFFDFMKDADQMKQKSFLDDYLFSPLQ